VSGAIKPFDELKPALIDVILFAEKTDEAFSEYRKGSFTRKGEGAFLDELALW
jgi:hypothetical protein